MQNAPSLNELIENAVAEAQALEQRRVEEEQGLRQERVVERKAQVHTDLMQLFGDVNFIERFDMTLKVFELHDDHSGREGATFHDPATGKDWMIQRLFGRGKNAWSIYPQELNTKATVLTNATDLLVAIGEHRAAFAKRQAENAERERQREAWRLLDEQWEVEKAALIQQADQVHERLESLVEKLREQAIAAQWQWAEGKTLTVYKVTWCTGVAVGGDEEGFDYDSGWSLADRLNSEGYIALQSVSYRREGRSLRLSMEHHKPVFEQVVYKSIAELPDALMASAERLTVNGIARILHAGLDRKMRLVEIAESSMTFDLPHEPLIWVRNVVDRS